MSPSLREKAMNLVQEYLDNLDAVITLFGVSKRRFAIKYREPIVGFDEAEKLGLIELNENGVILCGRKLRLLP